MWICSECRTDNESTGLHGTACRTDLLCDEMKLALVGNFSTIYVRPKAPPVWEAVLETDSYEGRVMSIQAFVRFVQQSSTSQKSIKSVCPFPVIPLSSSSLLALLSMR